MIASDIVRDILIDEGINLEIQEEYSEDELYEFAEEICLKRDEVLMDIIIDAQDKAEIHGSHSE